MPDSFHHHHHRKGDTIVTDKQQDGTNDRDSGQSGSWEGVSVPLGAILHRGVASMPDGTEIGSIGQIEDDEVFDITKPRDIRQDALLAIDVLNGFARGTGPLTHSDAGRIAFTIRAMISRLDKLATAPDVAALAIKLADAEERLAKYDGIKIEGVDEMAKTLRGSAFSREQLNTAANLLERMRAAIRHDREHAGKLEARNRTQAETIEQLQAELVGITHDKDQAEAAYERGDLERANLERKLADMTTNRDALDEACQRKDARIADLEAERDRLIDRITFRHREIITLGDRVVDLTNERDKAARDRDAMGEQLERAEDEASRYQAERDAARDIAARFRDELTRQTDLVDRLTDAVDREANDIGGEGSLTVLRLLGPNLTSARAALATVPGDMEAEQAIRRSRDAFIAAIHKATPNGQYVEVQHHPNGDWSVCDTPTKPRCRVVTSPRFYGEADRGRAARAFHDDALGASDHAFPDRGEGDKTRDWCFEVVDCVAEALGMRRAGA